MKTQKQDRTLCGYFSCAFATALCNQINIETISFEEDKLIEHFIKCIISKKTEMFPNNLKKVYNTKKNIINYTRNSY